MNQLSEQPFIKLQNPILRWASTYLDSDTTQEPVTAIVCRSLRTEQMFVNVKDIDQTDFHRSEPSSRILY